MTTTPLPQKTCIGVGYFDEHLFGYTEEQMIEYGQRCADAERDRLTGPINSGDETVDFLSGMMGMK